MSCANGLDNMTRQCDTSVIGEVLTASKLLANGKIPQPNPSLEWNVTGADGLDLAAVGRSLVPGSRARSVTEPIPRHKWPFGNGVATAIPSPHG